MPPAGVRLSAASPRATHISAHGCGLSATILHARIVGFYATIDLTLHGYKSLTNPLQINLQPYRAVIRSVVLIVNHRVFGQVYQFIGYQEIINPPS